LGLTFILASTISIPFAQMLTEYEHLPLSLRVAQVAFSIFGIKSFVDYSNIKGMFDPRNNEIKMDSKDESLVQFMAHEYAHFVQGYLLKDEKKQSQDFLIFREGHAIGVQNFISRKYFDDSSDRSQLEMNLKLNLSFLKTAYGGLCEKFNQEPKNEILSKGSLNMYQSYAHSIGCALFSLYEDKLGDRIYLDVLNGEFDPSLLLE
jgi:hypothetical protein